MSKSVLDELEVRKVLERFGRDYDDLWLSSRPLKCWVCGSVKRRYIVRWKRKGDLAVYYCTSCRGFNILRGSQRSYENEDGTLRGIGL